ncbi:MAG: endonuclease/exonuclease/phosphatase family protein [Pseudobdellovibrionaceae bacterium]|nr:endonuclease/exonuclease/phosphatase family protein [Bdellovibrionales bacterium]USN46909.1 MAG: endonuclease/exonuclease/phosphatase family protein [Pseudobdellovibrionaceae bacterium]
MRSPYFRIRWFILLLIFWLSSAAFGQAHKILTWNILLDGAIDKWVNLDIPFWYFRKDEALDLIRAQDPDLMGVFEPLPYQRTFLVENLPAYKNVDFDSFTDAVLFYRRDRYEELEKGRFFLSSNPERSYSLGLGNHFPRIAVWVRLKDKQTGEKVFLAGTHFDAKTSARRKMAPLFYQTVNRLAKGDPIMAIGDFNIAPDDQAYAVLAKQDWVDTYNMYFKEKLNRSHPTKKDRRIDHVLLGGKKLYKVNSWKTVVADKLSDHNPVVVVLEHAGP